MRLLSDLPEAPVVPCARCSEPSTPGEVWEHPVCDGCFARWLVEAPNAGEAERLSTPAQLAASRAAGGLLCAFYRAWTAAWLERAKAEAA